MGDLISREAAIEALMVAIDDVGILDSDDVKVVFDNLPSAQRWIPVSERLPREEKKSYWVCTDKGSQHECRWTNANLFWPNLTTEWRWNLFDVPQYSKIIAWMPLPEPWKGEKDER